jgi:hypothetical protein
VRMARLRALWSVWTVGVRISLGAFLWCRDDGAADDGTRPRSGLADVGDARLARPHHVVRVYKDSVLVVAA